MIAFVTDSGVTLDLLPNTDFEIVFENPLFQDDRMPSAWSTSVNFPPSKTNKEVFGYIPAMMWQPSVASLSVTMYLGGIPLYKGTLEYNGMEDGDLQYTFTTLSISDRLEGKLYEQVNGQVLYSLATDTTKTFAVGRLLTMLRNGVSGVRTPMMINASHTGEFTDSHYTKAAENTIEEAEVDKDVKFMNYPDNTTLKGLLPVFTFSQILSSAAPSISMDLSSEVADYLEFVCLIAQNRKAYATKFINLAIVSYTFDLAKFLPDVSVRDFIENVCKMFGIFIFEDGGGAVMKDYDSISKSSDLLNWDGKVSDVYKLSVEDGKRYKFAFSGNEGDDSYSTNETDSTDPIEVDTLYEVVSEKDSDGNDVDRYTYGQYVNVKYTPTGDIYSVMMCRIVLSTEREKHYLVDNLHAGLAESIEQGKEDRDEEDASVNFKVAKCVPFKYTLTDSESGHVNYRRMCPVISLPTSSDRSSEMIIGYYTNRQLVDKGHCFTWDSDSGNTTTEETAIGQSLLPSYIFEHFHTSLAAWVNKDKRCVSADLNLDIQDLTLIRLWQKVLIRGCAFWIKKLTLTFNSSRDTIVASGEFVEA